MKLDPDDRRRPILEQWWLGFVTLFLLAAAVLLLLLCRLDAAECTLEWNPQPDATGFRIYCGLDLLAEVNAPATQATVTLPDSGCTVALVAVNAAGQSLPAILHTVFIQDQDSTDLMAWRTLRGYHRELVPGSRFYRTRIEIP